MEGHDKTDRQQTNSFIRKFARHRHIALFFIFLQGHRRENKAVTFTFDPSQKKERKKNSAQPTELLHFVHLDTELRLIRQSRTSYLAVLSKLNPAAGVWWIFDSAILDPSAPAVRRCAWGRRWLRRPPSSFRFHSEKMETRGAYSAVNGVSTGVSRCHFNGYFIPTNTIKRKTDRRAFLCSRSWVRDAVFAECFARSETTSCAFASPLTSFCCWFDLFLSGIKV